MRLKIRTSVKAPLKSVKEGFTKELFLALNPPFPSVRLLQFDGCETGDKVSLELNFLLFRQEWTSEITHHLSGDTKWVFVDEGVKLPFFLSRWTHHHEVQETFEISSDIIDDISYATGTILTDLLMYPVLYLQFLYRRPIYKRIFTKKAS
ncbi:MAG: hypothetical protein JXR10_12465 [Cyclobacteriaceae bacterium]